VVADIGVLGNNWNRKYLQPSPVQPGMGQMRTKCPGRHGGNRIRQGSKVVQGSGVCRTGSAENKRPKELS